MKYSQEQKEFLTSFIPLHTHNETVIAFNKRFPDNPITLKQSRAFSKNNHIKSANDGKFKKGIVAYNKGMNQSDFMTPEAIERTKATRFKKGNKPKSWKPVGTKVKIDGFWKIKIEEPNKWKLLHVYNYEKKHGVVPPRHRIIFLDGNTDNCEVDNLAMVSLAENVILNNKKWRSEYKEITEAYLNVVRLENEGKRLKDGKNK